MREMVRPAPRAELKTVQEIVEIERERLAADERTPLFTRLLPALAFIAALWWAKVVIIPIVLSMLISYALEPVVARMVRWRVPREVAAPIVMGALALIVGATAYALRGEASAFVDRIPAAIHDVSERFSEITNRGRGPLAKVKDAANELENAAHAPSDGVPAVRVEQPTFKWTDWVWQGSRSALELGGQLFAVLCLTYCLLAAGDLYKRKLVHIVPTFSNKKVTVQILAEIDRQIERFLLARTGVSLIVGVAFGVAFRMFGMQQPAVWGVIAAILFTIPIVGPTIFIVASALAALVQFGSVGIPLGVLAAGLIIAALEGNVLTPLMMSRVGEMNAAAVFVSLLFWGWLWGLWGLLLAVPITASIKAVCERIPELNGVAEILKA